MFLPANSLDRYENQANINILYEVNDERIKIN